MSNTSGQESMLIGKFTLDEIRQAREGVFETAADTMYIFDIETQKILDMNPSGLRLLGYTLKEVREMDFIDLHAIEERERAEEIVAIYKRDGGITGVRDLHLRKKDGALVPVEKNGRITYVDGKAIGH